MNKKNIPLSTIIFMVFCTVVGIWFISGGSFKLYASVFFYFYYFTNQVWVSVILIGIFQNLAFLPLRSLGLRFATNIKTFEDKLEVTKQDDQYLVFKDKVRYGDSSVIFYIINFIIYAIAFVSAGKLFLIDFYTKPLDPKLLHSWSPYPTYPLNGSIFELPYINITSTMAIPWEKIILLWLIITAFIIVPKFIWTYLKSYLTHNKELLTIRIKYNRLYLKLTGIIGTLFFLSLYFLRNVPTSFDFITLSLDLTKQNSTMNLITATATFLVVLHAGYNDNKKLYEAGFNSGIEKPILDLVFKDKIRASIKNGLILGIGAYYITNQIPSAFELSVATFEAIIFLSPYTFDKFLLKTKPVISTV